MAADAGVDDEPRLTVVGDWLTTSDGYHSKARDSFIMYTILAGANSVAKFMATTYLAQFKDLEGEFAKRPVYRPDFVVGYIPHSNLILTHLNDNARRNLVDFHIDDEELKVTCSIGIAPGAQSWLETFLRDGAQFSRLYRANKKILKGHDSRQLFNAVRDCYHRDSHLAEMFSYLEEPAVEEED